MKSITAALIMALISATAFAMNPEDLQWVAQKDQEHLFIHFRDLEPQTNSCGLMVTKFEYLPVLNSLSLELGRDRCAFDLLDRSRGVHIWKLPHFLRHGGELHLYLQGRSVGTLYLTMDGVRLERAPGALGEAL